MIHKDNDQDDTHKSSLLQLPFRHEPHPLQCQFQHLQLSLVNANICCVGLNRPSKRNALNREMLRELQHLFQTILGNGQDDASRVVLLYGNGPMLSAGIDLSDSSLMMSPGTTDVAHQGLLWQNQIQQMQDCLTALEQCPLPILVAVHGKCWGAGIDLVTAADVIWCTRDSDFAVKEVQLGLTADLGTLQRLPKRCGNLSWMYDVCYSGRSFSAQEALQMGLVNRICETREELFQHALEWCQRIATYSPVAIRGIKQSILYARDHSVFDGLQQVVWYNAMALQGKDLQVAWQHQTKNATSSKRRRNSSNKVEPEEQRRHPQVTFPDLPPRPKL